MKYSTSTSIIPVPSINITFARKYPHSGSEPGFREGCENRETRNSLTKQRLTLDIDLPSYNSSSEREGTLLLRKIK